MISHTPPGQRTLILHKSEWKTLKKRASPPEKPSQEKNEHLKSLIEMSQAWIRTWPDTIQGYVAQRKKQEEKQRAEKMAAIKAFSKKEINTNSTEAIQKAKQKIFDESCYGKKLLSALRESKALEERDAQIKFKETIKAKEADLERKSDSMKFCSFDLDKNADAMEDHRKCITTQISLENKEIYEKQKEDETKAKEQEKLAALEDAQLMKYLLDREQEAEEKLKFLEKQALEQYAAEDKKTKEDRAQWEAEYYANIDKCRKEQDEINHKIKQVLKSINKGTSDSTIKKSIYEMVEQCQEEEKKRYNILIEKNCQEGEERAAKRDRKTKEKEKQNRDNRVSAAEVNKKLAEYVRQRQCSNKCFCDRQTLMLKSDKESAKKGKYGIEPRLKERQTSLRIT